MVKRYEVNGEVFTFDIVDSCNTLKGVMYVATCRENGKDAWLDSNGVQFMGERRIEAKEVFAQSLPSPSMPYGYSIWGGQIRDSLPHGRRYYMNGRRW